MRYRSRPDAQLETGFHCTRVKDPSAHDWGVYLAFGHIWRDRFAPLIIETDEEGDLRACIYSYYDVCADGRGCSRLFFSIGRGSMMRASKKLGLATANSAETEVVSLG